MSCYVYVHALCFPRRPRAHAIKTLEAGLILEMLRHSAAEDPCRCYLRSELVLHSCSIDNIIPSDRRYILSMVVGA